MDETHARLAAVVARTPHRETIARRWGDFRTFLNPVAELTAREAEQAKRG